MSNIINKMLAYLKLIRVHTLIATALTPSLGAFATLSVLDNGLIPENIIMIIIPLFLVGLIVHTFGEILNDYIDYDIDKKNKELSSKPLVSGEVSKKAAQIALIVLFTLFILIIYFARFNLLSIIMLASASITGIIYQLISKKWIHSAVFLGLYAFFIIIFGGVYAGSYDSLYDVPNFVYIIAILGFFQLWINTAILGHLKDIKNDSECKVRTFPMLFGVKVKGEGEKPTLIIPNSFKSFVIAVQIINLGVAFIPIIYFERYYNINFNYIFVLIGLLFFSLFIMISQIKVLMQKKFERNKLMRMMAVREISAYYLAIVLLYPMMGLIFLLIFTFLPLIWFFIVNLVFTKNVMQAAI